MREKEPETKQTGAWDQEETVSYTQLTVTMNGYVAYDSATSEKTTRCPGGT